MTILKKMGLDIQKVKKGTFFLVFLFCKIDQIYCFFNAYIKCHEFNSTETNYVVCIILEKKSGKSG